MLKWSSYTSVRQSIRPSVLFLQLNRTSWNLVVMKDILCRCAYSREILIFPWELHSYWTWTFCQNLNNYTSETVCHRNSFNCTTEMCTCAYSQEILIWFLTKLYYFVQPLWNRLAWMPEKLFNQIHVHVCFWQWTSKCYTNVTIINRLNVYPIITRYIRVWFCLIVHH